MFIVLVLNLRARNYHKITISITYCLLSYYFINNENLEQLYQILSAKAVYFSV